MIRPKKYLGQHFLKDEETAKKIVDAIAHTNLPLIEIGPGTGVLTKYLITKDKFFAVDIDQESIAYLKKAYDTGIEHTTAGTTRTGILNDTQEARQPRSPVAKEHYEIKQINEGKVPYSLTGEKLAPEEQAKQRNDLLLDIVKKTTDPATRMKLQNATNMNITLDSINPDALTIYSGGEGQVNKHLDSVLAAAGDAPPKYEAYLKETTKASFAAKQMRQYLGDSIQPTAQDRLDKLSKPEAWNVPPKVAKENFEFMRDLYKRETNTLVRAATDPSIYQAQSSPASNSSKVFNLATGAFE